MLFNSIEFIFVYLPLTLAAFFLVARRAGHDWARAFLVVASLVFFSWWNLYSLPVLLGSIIVNFGLAHLIRRARDRGQEPVRRALTVLGVAGNLALLGWFKYALFATGIINQLLGTGLVLEAVILPLGISFFTFQKIAFLLDVSGGLVRRIHSLDYALFVTFFPQLIAGPIVHHAEVMPQFRQDRIFYPDAGDMAAGLTLFAFGLIKKVLLADPMGAVASPLFQKVAAGGILTMAESWLAAFGFTLQLYFDFSGYSDMAIGLARLFGVRLPLNFNSPLKAASIIDFWRRWHMSLSRFLRDYLYIPLGGNRQGPARRHVNLMLVMLIGGLWHGANWTFVLWGGIHGLALLCNHAWHAVRGRPRGQGEDPAVVRILNHAATLLVVVIAFVFFRAPDMASGWVVVRGMAGHGVAAGAVPWAGCVMAAGLLALALAAPNTQEILGDALDRGRAEDDSQSPRYGARPGRFWGWAAWRADRRWAVAVALGAFAALLHVAAPSEFLYFNF